MVDSQELGLIFVISAPAGAGKTTLVRRLLEEDGTLCANVSYTTRPPRHEEKEGRDYHFISKDQFLAKQKKGEFLEWVNIAGYYYGCCVQHLQQSRESGRDVILVIDTEGAKKIRQFFSAYFIFIHPPSFSVLSERLKKRGTETDEEIEKRLKKAQAEINEAQHYDYQLVNKNLDQSYATLRQVIQERQKNAKRRRQSAL